MKTFAIDRTYRGGGGERTYTWREDGRSMYVDVIEALKKFETVVRYIYNEFDSFLC